MVNIRREILCAGSCGMPFHFSETEEEITSWWRRKHVNLLLNSNKFNFTLPQEVIKCSFPIIIISSAAQPVIAHHGVEDWLGRVESGMRATLRRLILKHVEDDLDLPTSELPLQASTLFLSVYWMLVIYVCCLRYCCNIWSFHFTFYLWTEISKWISFSYF